MQNSSLVANVSVDEALVELLSTFFKRHNSVESAIEEIDRECTHEDLTSPNLRKLTLEKAIKKANTTPFTH